MSGIRRFWPVWVRVCEDSLTQRPVDTQRIRGASRSAGYARTDPRIIGLRCNRTVTRRQDTVRQGRGKTVASARPDHAQPLPARGPPLTRSAPANGGMSAACLHAPLHPE